MKIQSIKGMKDMLPTEAAAWQYLENTVRDLLQAYGYAEIRTPILEKTDLFKRSIGEVTDIVEKEMYTFEDRNGDSLTLRPEGTASVVRAGIQNGLFHNQTQKLWYKGPMFRHERPQKGRFRQFHQIGAEAFGFTGPNIDAEIIILTARLWKKLGLNPTLELNSIGSLETRNQYRKALVDYFTPYTDDLDADSQRRLTRNPMRILDSKDPKTQALVASAPVLTDFLSPDEQAHFSQLQALLADAGIAYVLNPRLVRGLDYYSLTVFEWVTDQLGAQSAICSGGRYDGLIPQLGGKPMPAIGWGMGLERVIMLLEENNCPIPELNPDIYLICLDAAFERQAFLIAEKTRDALDKVKLTVDYAGGSMKTQIKRADKSGAQVALILGEGEFAQESMTVKPLRGGEQTRVKWSELNPYLEKLLSEA